MAYNFIKNYATQSNLCFYEICKEMSGRHNMRGKGCTNPTCRFSHSFNINSIIDQFENSRFGTSLCVGYWSDLFGQGVICQGDCGFAHSIDEMNHACAIAGVNPAKSVEKSFKWFKELNTFSEELYESLPLDLEEGLTEEDENNMDSCPNDEDDEYEKIQQELRQDYLNIWTSDGEVPFSEDEIRRGVANMTKVIGRITERQQQLGLN